MLPREQRPFPSYDLPFTGGGTRSMKLACLASASEGSPCMRLTICTIRYRYLEFEHKNDVIHAPTRLEQPPFWTTILLALSLFVPIKNPSGMSPATGTACGQRCTGPIDHRTSLHNHT